MDLAEEERLLRQELGVFGRQPFGLFGGFPAFGAINTGLPEAPPLYTAEPIEARGERRLAITNPPPPPDQDRSGTSVFSNQGLLNDNADLLRLLDEKIRPEKYKINKPLFTLRSIEERQGTFTTEEAEMATSLAMLAAAVKRAEPLTQRKLYTIRQYTRLAVTARLTTKGAENQREKFAQPQDVRHAMMIVDNDGQATRVMIKMKVGGMKVVESKASTKRLRS